MICTIGLFPKSFAGNSTTHDHTYRIGTDTWIASHPIPSLDIHHPAGVRPGGSFQANLFFQR
jgi:hypothetical protein